MNVGRKCNQACHHCHVDAGPDRTEMMPDDVVDAAHILKGEKNGMKLIGQAFQVRDGLSKFDGNQREWFLKNTFGVYRKARRGYLRIVR